jgi:hypothetical protein
MSLRGTVAATGFILDVPAVGEAEARRRVLAHWGAGATLSALPDGRWLLLLDAPLTVRAERAPGLPVIAREDALLAAGAEPPLPGPGLYELRHGRLAAHRLGALAPLDPAAWVTLPPAVELRVLDAPPPPPQRVRRPEATADPDLRGSAKLGMRPEAVERLVSAPPRRSGLLALLVLRTPLRGAVDRRHTRYIQRLTRAFEQGDYEEALRDAVGLGGESGQPGWVTLRLPKRHRGPLEPTARLGGAGAAVPWGGNIYTHLRQLYQRAAERLERDGEIERAAFIHADLLDAPRDAVALLERHARYELGARLAEGRGLEAELVVRLWWAAGDRGRAVAVARARGAWAGGIYLLERTDPELALELRAAWVLDARRRGDHRGAIEAAWPAESLRATIGDDLAGLRALGGPQSATGLGLELAWRPDAGCTAEALAEIAGGEQRLALLRTLAERPAADQAADRRLVSAGVRALLRDGAAREVHNRLRERTDPLLHADLPAFKPVAREEGVPELDAGHDRGAIGVRDAVALGRGVLAAAGERGLLWLAPDGRVTARWDVPAHRLVVADHGSAVLVAAPGEHRLELQRFDLVTRRLTPLPALERHLLPDSYDGAVLHAAGEQAIVALDLLADPPRALWAQEERTQLVVAFARSPTRMSAVLELPLLGRLHERNVERWTWELPSLRLRIREPLEGLPDGVAADGALFATGEVRRRDGRELPRVPDGWALVVSGDRSALAEPGRIVLRGQFHEPEVAVAFPDAPPPRFRAHGELATVWTDDGRIAVVDLAARELRLSLRTRA